MCIPKGLSQECHYQNQFHTCIGCLCFCICSTQFSRNYISSRVGSCHFVSWYFSFFLVSCCSGFLFFLFLVLLAMAEKSNNELENKRPNNQEPPQKNKTAHPKGGSSGRELGLVIFCFCFFCFFLVSYFFVFFGSWFLVLFSHCRKTKQKLQKLSMVAKQ